MYCTLPPDGGSTNFRNAMVHVKPSKGAAVFFSYIDPETLLMDNGLTEHSGCPVFEGEKKIVTQWVRYGVDKENPWNSFNTLGMKMHQMHLIFTHKIHFRLYPLPKRNKILVLYS